MITGVVNDDDPDNYSFTLDSRSVNVLGVGEFYETDVGEMRAALGGQAAWESYILSRQGVQGPHLNKATRLGLIGNVKAALADLLIDKAGSIESFKKLDLRELAPLLGKGIIAAAGALEEGSLHEENIRRLYNYVLSFAQECYGRKYIVDLPDVSVKRDSDTGELTFSLEPTEGGFLEESLFLTAVGLKLMPPDVNFVLTQDPGAQAHPRRGTRRRAGSRSPGQRQFGQKPRRSHRDCHHLDDWRSDDRCLVNPLLRHGMRDLVE